jgi:hypothetical protein
MTHTHTHTHTHTRTHTHAHTHTHTQTRAHAHLRLSMSAMSNQRRRWLWREEAISANTSTWSSKVRAERRACFGKSVSILVPRERAGSRTCWLACSSTASRMILSLAKPAIFAAENTAARQQNTREHASPSIPRRGAWPDHSRIYMHCTHRVRRAPQRRGTFLPRGERAPRQHFWWTSLSEATAFVAHTPGSS